MVSMPASSQCARGNRHRDSPDDVGTARFFTIGQSGPVHLGRRHDIHRSATLVLRIALRGRGRERPTSAPVPNGAYILCAENATKSRCSGSWSGLTSMRRWGASWAASTRMRRPDGVCLSRQTMDGLDEAGDVRGAADRQQGDAVAEGREQPIDVVFVKAAVLRHLRSNHVSTTAPRQVVRVVLHYGREHHVPSHERIAEGELVDGFSRVLPEE